MRPAWELDNQISNITVIKVMLSKVLDGMRTNNCNLFILKLITKLSELHLGKNKVLVVICGLEFLLIQSFYLQNGLLPVSLTHL